MEWSHVPHAGAAVSPFGAAYPAAAPAPDDLAAFLLDLGQQGLILVDPGLTILCMNAIAEGFLDPRGDLRAVNGRLVLARREDGARLRGAVEAATRRKGSDSDSPFRPPWIRISVPGEDAVLTVDPLSSRAAALRLVATTSRHGSAAEALRQLYGLTAMEGRVADLLATGRQPAEVAAALRVSVHTVRSHLKEILFKTGLRRQADVTALVVRLRA